ncbi:hypothetical protein GCM10018777_04540 [Streptomyces albogriseolus]|nr:hypothetical protein GCM10018777_04540 [Streptomyces viridodiastaticus]
MGMASFPPCCAYRRDVTERREAQRPVTPPLRAGEDIGDVHLHVCLHVHGTTDEEDRNTVPSGARAPVMTRGETVSGPPKGDLTRGPAQVR